LIQGNIQEALAGLRQDRKDLENKKAELADFQEEQQKLKALKQTEERALAGKKKEKDELLRLTKGKEALFQQLLQNKKRDIAVLKTQLFYLEKTGITAEDAVKYADLAAKRTGIRTAFLLALLEVETGKQFEDGQFSVGTNIGTGNWQRDLYQCYINLGKRSAAESEKNAFFSITSKLNLDPDRMPVSRKPSYGCGGAMGPAQFLPTTWLRFEDRVAELTGHNPPNPWNIEDSFTAAAIFLADAGASSQTQAGEIAAAKTYISGNANCTKYICRSYSSRIISLARDIDRVL
jgi:membrane-bound lytic murein transglycosylase B